MPHVLCMPNRVYFEFRKPMIIYTSINMFTVTNLCFYNKVDIKKNLR